MFQFGKRTFVKLIVIPRVVRRFFQYLVSHYFIQIWLELRQPQETIQRRLQLLDDGNDYH